MTEERLKEIKQDIEVMDTYGGYKDRYLELYNEVVRLREIIKEAKDEIEYFELQAKHLDDSIYLDETLTNKLLDILEQNNLTLEQLNGVENE